MIAPAKTKQQTVRCAVYTRKSVVEGLDQEGHGGLWALEAQGSLAVHFDEPGGAGLAHELHVVVEPADHEVRATGRARRLGHLDRPCQRPERCCSGPTRRHTRCHRAAAMGSFAFHRKGTN